MRNGSLYGQWLWVSTKAACQLPNTGAGPQGHQCHGLPWLNDYGIYEVNAYRSSCLPSDPRGSLGAMENPDPVLERRRLMWRLAIRLTRLLMEGYGPILEAKGVTVSRDDVLMGLSVSQADLAGSPHNIASLAEIYGKSPATIMRWVDKFERVGVIYTTREGASRIIRVSPEWREEHGHLADQAIDDVMFIIKTLSI